MDQYFEDLVALLVNSVSLVLILTRLGITGVGKWSDWGQSATLTTSFIGTLHWCYVALPELLQWLSKIIENRKYALCGLRPCTLAWRLCQQSRLYYSRFWFKARSLLLPQAPTPEIPRSAEALIEDLVTSARLGDLGGVEHFLEQGAPLNGMNSKRTTALCAASAGGHIAVVQCLLRYGAAVAIRLDGLELKPLVRGSAIHAAIEWDNIEILEILLRHINALDPSRQHLYGAEDVERTPQCFTRMYAGDPDEFPAVTGHTPLLLAVVLKRRKAVAKLLLFGASPYYYQGKTESYTPLLIAAQCGDLVILAMLCAYMDHLDQKGCVETRDQPQATTTALHMCAQSTNLDSVKLLLDLNANPNIKDNRGNLPLHHAVQYGSTDMVSLLASTSKVDAMGAFCTALEHTAARGLSVPKALALLEHGASVAGSVAREPRCFTQARTALSSAASGVISIGPSHAASASRAPKKFQADETSASHWLMMEAILKAADIRPCATEDTVSVLVALPDEALHLLPSFCRSIITPKTLRQKQPTAQQPSSKRSLRDDMGTMLWKERFDFDQKTREWHGDRFFNWRVYEKVYMVHLARRRRPARSLETLDIDLPISFTKQSGSIPFVLHEREAWRYERTFFLSSDRKHRYLWHRKFEQRRLQSNVKYTEQLRRDRTFWMLTPTHRLYRKGIFLDNQYGNVNTMKQLREDLTELDFDEIVDHDNLIVCNDRSRKILRTILAL